MLRDHWRKQAEAAKAAARRYQTHSEMGDYISQRALWSWWATFTFRRRPSRAYAIAELRSYLQELETAAARAIGWVFIEDRGNDGFLHFHLLIAGVDHLPISIWENKANRRFGNSEISHYSNEGGAAYYLAKKAQSEKSTFEFGGGLNQAVHWNKAR